MRETNVAVNKLLGIVVNGKKLIGFANIFPSSLSWNKIGSEIVLVPRIRNIQGCKTRFSHRKF